MEMQVVACRLGMALLIYLVAFAVCGMRDVC